MAKKKEPKYDKNKTYKVNIVYEIDGKEMEEFEQKILANKKKKYWFYEEKINFTEGTNVKT